MSAGGGLKGWEGGVWGGHVGLLSCVGGVKAEVCIMEARWWCISSSLLEDCGVEDEGGAERRVQL